MSRKTSLIVLLGVVASLALAQARQPFLIDDPMHRDVIQVTSTAPLEVIVTRTQEVTGSIDFDRENALNNPQAHFEIDVDKLSTGIPLRDEHMRGEAWFDTARYPKITLDLKEVKTQAQAAKLEPNVPVDVDAVGALTVKGITKDVPLKLNITLLPRTEATSARLPGDLLRIHGTFDFFLSDHGIQLRGPTQLKIANRQSAEVWLLASTEKVQPPAN